MTVTGPVSSTLPEDVNGLAFLEEDAAGRDDILEEAMRLYGDAVVHLAYTYMKDYAMAEDIAQEVFLRVYRHIHRFEGRGSLKTWIFSITANYCKDQLRSWALRKLLPFADPGEPEERVASAESETLRNLENSELWKAVMSLPIKYREVLIMHYQQELTTSAIADVLGVREQTIRTRLHRAREGLRNLLEEGGLAWMHSSGESENR